MFGKLGKLPARNDPRTLKLANYLQPGSLPLIPQQVTWGNKVPEWPMFLNDTLGDCTCAAAGHLIQMWTADHHHEITPTDDDILQAYEAVGHYDPSDSSTDQGAVEIDVLNYWRQTGIADHQILAYVSVNPRNKSHLLAAMFLFGGLYIGVQLPLSAQAQVGGLWTTTGGDASQTDPGTWGGHAIPLVIHNQSTWSCVTWGKLQKMDDGFVYTYVDEVYALVSEDWANKHVGAPSGFDLGHLMKDLKLVTN